MSHTVIHAENLSKRYRIGERERYLALRDVLTRALSAPARLFRSRVPVSGNGTHSHIRPLKHYSTGMQMRLAFAVAAHLEPEILLVDEVLAVGDVAFQKKCLGKMGDVAKAGRTILFVSHQLSAVRSLCTRALLLSDGRKVFEDRVDQVIERYLQQSLGRGSGGRLHAAM